MKNILFLVRKNMEQNNHNFYKYKVNFEEIDRFLGKFSFCDYKTFLSENAMYEKLVKSNGFKYKRHKIKNWESYENNESDLSQEDFFEIFLKNVKENEGLLLFTDEGILEKCTFKLKVSEFYSFSSLYEDQYNMEFFQLSFYCVLFVDLGICKFLDDNGFLNEISLEKN